MVQHLRTECQHQSSRLDLQPRLRACLVRQTGRPVGFALATIQRSVKLARTLPERFLSPLNSLARMTEANYAHLRSELSGDQFFANEKALGQVIKSAVPSLSKADVKDLGMFIEAMSAVSQREGSQDISEVLSDMLDSDNVALSNPEKSNALHRALELTSLTPVQTLANIQEMYFKHERPLSGASVLVDVRPAFSREGTLQAMTLWQTLSVTYETNSGEEASIEFAVDKDDLLKIRREIDSALGRVQTVQEEFTKAGLRMWAPTSKLTQGEES